MPMPSPEGATMNPAGTNSRAQSNGNSQATRRCARLESMIAEV
jgi:hypothetical protein